MQNQKFKFGETASLLGYGAKKIELETWLPLAMGCTDGLGIGIVHLVCRRGPTRTALRRCTSILRCRRTGFSYGTA